mmetsp:Transcript_11505/g.29471  ORF Transcript_11505/g.29471 Transcript_11505/m.29471 type:complete len:155 (-) Transcript_11505:86-550(-)
MEDDRLAGLTQELKLAQKRHGRAAAAGAATVVPSGQGRQGWAPRTRDLEAESDSGYSWRETEAEIEVRVPLPHGIGARDLAVEIGATALRVSIAGDELMGGVLCGALLVEDSTWCVERTAELDEPPVLQLDLLKKERTASDAPLWECLFREDEV